jgi:radical SAM protein with 4Fe4S-binding SPASM domain
MTMAVAARAMLEETPVAEAAAGRYLPHVVAWNLTKRCNLECAHCYISAGPSETAERELTTAECLRIAGEILAVNPAPLFILSGGEPLLRNDLEDIARYASSHGATVVVGTNGTLLTDERIASLKAAGVTGFAISVDSLDHKHHDNFRHGKGALEATTEAIGRLRRHRIDFIVQTTITKGNRGELSRLVAWAAEQGAVSFNAYFLVPTGRGARLSDLTAAEYESVLAELVVEHQRYLGRMLVRSKCAPHFMRHVHQAAPESPILNYETRCPCGTQYCRITPEGKLTPCPYLPESAGDLRQEEFGSVWGDSALFRRIRSGKLGGKCGSCEYREMCGGCRARAFAVEGDVLASDPSCSYEPTGSVPVVRSARAVTYGAAAAPRKLQWSADAEARIARIPSFVRGVVMGRIEDYARRQGATEVTLELMREVRRAMPVDFSKRAPFFLSDD